MTAEMRSAPSGRAESCWMAVGLIAAFVPLACLSPPLVGDDLWCRYPAADGPGAGKKIVLISGDEEYRSEESLPMLGKLLARRHGFHCVVLFSVNPVDGTIDPNVQDNIPGMEEVADADLLVLTLRFRQLPDEQMKPFVDYVQSGRPIIGLRTSTHAFRYPGDRSSPFADYSFDSSRWPGGFGRQVLGETWVNHHGHHKVESTRGVVAADQADHPILRGVRDVWGPTDVYTIGQLPDDATVLLRGQVLTGMNPDDPPLVGAKNDPMMPLAWIRKGGENAPLKNRIFCTTLGASQDFLAEGSRRLIVNAAYWCLELEHSIDPARSVEPWGDFRPTPYGFDGFQRGIRPSDHAGSD